MSSGRLAPCGVAASGHWSLDGWTSPRPPVLAGAGCHEQGYARAHAAAPCDRQRSVWFSVGPQISAHVTFYHGDTVDHLTRLSCASVITFY